MIWTHRDVLLWVSLMRRNAWFLTCRGQMTLVSVAVLSAHLLAVVARLVRVDVLVLVGAGPLGRGVLHARLVLSFGHPPWSLYRSHQDCRTTAPTWRGDIDIILACSKVATLASRGTGREGNLNFEATPQVSRAV